MNQSNAGHQGLPPPLHHPRSASLIQQQQRRPISPHQPQPIQTQPIQTTQGPYISPLSSTQSLSQHHQSPYIGTVPSLPSHHPHETTFFGAHPSPYSTNSAAGSYASSEPNESMATQAAMPRASYPPISSYQTPQSNSPASIHSPQTDVHGRALYAGGPSMPPLMYYTNQYHSLQQPSYGQHPTASHHPSMAPASGMLMSHQHAQPHLPPQQAQQGHPQTSMVDNKPPVSSLQRSNSVVAPPQGTPQPPSGPAPGPIPATTPLVVRQDNNGVQWIAFEYSRDRVKMEYTIRCDVESVNVDELSPDFKSANCVYPRACAGKDQYKGNRLHYESECNAVGWALAQLNPNLREKRGLIQRAVDSWRNSNQDVRLRSRRVRRMAKIHNRAKQPSATGTYPGASGQASAALQPPQSMPPDVTRPPNMGPGAQHMHHHYTDAKDSGGGNDVSVRDDYHSNPQASDESDLASPSVPRNVLQSYPQQQVNVGGDPTMPGASSHVVQQNQQPTGKAMMTALEEQSKEDNEEHERQLFGDIPEAKRRKFILVDDYQRGTRIRVRVMLDQVKMDDMPDAHLKANAVFPRSYYPLQMRSPPNSPGGGARRGARDWDDEDDDAVKDGSAAATPLMPTSKTYVNATLVDGSETKLAVPRMTKSRRLKEVAVNELAYRMSWGQARTFVDRTLFLQRSLDAFRNKVRSSMVANGTDVKTIPAHLETRPGKRKWQERMKRMKRMASPLSPS